MRVLLTIFSVLLISGSVQAADGWAVTLGWCSQSQLDARCRNARVPVCHNGTQKPRCVKAPACACPLVSAFHSSDDANTGLVLPAAFLEEVVDEE